MLRTDVKDVCDSLGLKLHETQNPVLVTMAHNLGYEPLGYGTIYEDDTTGILISMSEENNKYNNAVYMLHLLGGGEYVLETIIPNTADKSVLVRETVSKISGFIESLDASDLGVYDFVEIYGYVIANTVAKRLADKLFPNDSNKREAFVLLYMPRFLANVSILYSGVQKAVMGEEDKSLKDKINEETVNSEPFILKMMMEGDPNLGLSANDEL